MLEIIYSYWKCEIIHIRYFAFRFGLQDSLCEFVWSGPFPFLLADYITHTPVKSFNYSCYLFSKHFVASWKHFSRCGSGHYSNSVSFSFFVCVCGCRVHAYVCIQVCMHIFNCVRVYFYLCILHIYVVACLYLYVLHLCMCSPVFVYVCACVLPLFCVCMLGC